MVVDHTDLDRDAFGASRDQLLHGHLEAAVAVDGVNQLVRPPHLGADGRRDGVAHRAEAARVDPGTGLGVLPELRSPHLMLADAGDDDGVAPGDPVELFDDVLRLDWTVGVLLVTDCVILLPRSNGFQPCRPIGDSDILLDALFHPAGELVENHFGVADDGDLGLADLADLRGVDVDVDHLGAGGESPRISRHPVVEPGPNRQDHVGLLQRRDRRIEAVHARHPER